jgi:hypothetical protein
MAEDKMKSAAHAQAFNPKIIGCPKNFALAIFVAM